MRISKKDLEIEVNQLNALSKRKYKLVKAYGKYQLAVLLEGTAVNNVTGFLSARELYDIVFTIIKYILLERK